MGKTALPGEKRASIRPAETFSGVVAMVTMAEIERLRKLSRYLLDRKIQLNTPDGCRYEPATRKTYRIEPDKLTKPQNRNKHESQ